MLSALIGTNRADTLDGASHLDIVTFDGLGGNDFIVLDVYQIGLGGAGNDTIWAAEGNNIVSSGIGNDLIKSFTGADTIDAGAGNDHVSLEGTVLSSLVLGGTGNDLIEINGNSHDTVHGDGGNDTIDVFTFGRGTYDGGSGNDLLVNEGMSGGSFSGAAGNDTLLTYGGGSLDGGAGNDLLVSLAGGGGAVLTGGTGRDVFELHMLELSGTPNVIADFTHNVDRIALSAAEYAVGGVGALTASHFTLGHATHSEQLIYDAPTGWLSYSAADGSGGWAEHHVAQLGTDLTISARDFQIIA